MLRTSPRPTKVSSAAPALALLGGRAPLVALLALAAALRLWDLGGGPDMFDVDEGYTGVDALRVLQGGWTLYFAANNGAEPLYVYLAALSTALLGPSALALRLPAALAGAASVLATYLLVRAVFRDEEGAARLVPGRAEGAHAVALLAALLQTVSLWHLHLSRDASRVGLLPLLATLGFWLLWEGIRERQLGGHPPGPPPGERPCSPGEGGRLEGPPPAPARGALLDPRGGRPARGTPPSPPAGERPCTPEERGWSRWPWFVGAGACFGLALYTYLPARLLPLVALALVGHLALSRRAWLVARWRGLLLAALVAALVAAPLGAYYATHWTAFSFRVEMVSLANPRVHGGDPAGLLWRNLQGTAGMFAVRGDEDPEYNVLARPVFPPPLAALFALGLGVAVWRVRRPAYWLFLAWLGIMLLPGVLSENSPHFARQAGIIPAVYVFPALGGWQLWRWAWGLPLPPPWRARRPALLGLVALLVLGGAALGAVSDYFGRPPHPGPTLLARLATLPPAEEVYVAGSEETATVGSYLVGAGRESPPPPLPRFTQGFQSLLLPRDPARTLYLVETEWWQLGAEQLLWARYDLEPQPPPPGLERFRVLRLAERPGPEPWPSLPAVRWAIGARPVGYGLPAEAQPGHVVGVTLRWRVEQPLPDDPGQDYTFAVALVDAGGEEVARRDWLGHPTAAWRDGDEVASWFDLCLPPTLPPGPLQATVALYSRADFVRRPLLDAAGAPVGDHLVFGTLPVHGPPQHPPCSHRIHPVLPP